MGKGTAIWFTASCTQHAFIWKHWDTSQSPMLVFGRNSLESRMEPIGIRRRDREILHVKGSWASIAGSTPVVLYRDILVRKQGHSLCHTKNPVWFVLPSRSVGTCPQLCYVKWCTYVQSGTPTLVSKLASSLLYLLLTPTRNSSDIFFKLHCRIRFNGKPPTVATKSLPPRGQWTKFTKIFLETTKKFWSFFSLPSSLPSLQNAYAFMCTYMCMHVCTWMCVHMCVMWTCACVCAFTCAKHCKISRDVFLPWPTSAIKQRYWIYKSLLSLLLRDTWGGAEAGPGSNCNLWVRQANHMIKTWCDT